MDKIELKNMQFYGYHGVLPEETRLGQRFNIDLIVYADLRKAGQSDQLEDSINYAELYSVCKEVVEGQPYQLIEAVAESIATKVLAGYDKVVECMVKVVKPDPPIPGHYEHVAVEIIRSR
ncbi:dihydroneopterin aldolase [Bacillus sp. T3]|uniref:dihydroneopterin aldolase n=1 Tax=Bacillus sp. T3 TaxID=467262 RepID=UPI002981C09C|nr:dihydroneopterin aldolase [Bacillus sp. T3]